MKPKLPTRKKRGGKCHSFVMVAFIILSSSALLSLRGLENTSRDFTINHDESESLKKKISHDATTTTKAAAAAQVLVVPPTDAPRSSTTERIHIFIGIKTKQDGIYKERLPQIQKTWLKEALDMGIDINFFSEESPAAGRETNIRSNAKKINAKKIDTPNNNTVHEQEEDQSQLVDVKHMMVPLKCKTLVCKTGTMFKYYMEHYANKHKISFFCNFDDDNYLLPANLIQVLTSYHEQIGTNIYVGKQGDKDGLWYYLIPGDRDSRVKVKFLTGGAGVCLSKDLVERGQKHLSTLPNTMPDDMAVGYVVQEKLGVKLIEDDRFHSHLEGGDKVGIWFRIPKDQISKQVSFGYNNKHQREWARFAMPNVPILFSQDEDPLLFRSLHAFLMQEKAAAS